MVLADTSIWIDYLRADADVRPRMKSMLEARQLMTCGPVVAELLAGVRDRQAEALWESLIALRWAPLPADLWLAVGEAAGELRRRGRRLPLTDVAIGVAAARAGARLWTLDSDFERVADVVTDLELFA